MTGSNRGPGKAGNQISDAADGATSIYKGNDHSVCLFNIWIPDSCPFGIVYSIAEFQKQYKIAADKISKCQPSFHPSLAVYVTPRN